MAKRKAKIEYYWVATSIAKDGDIEYRVNWRLWGANGELVCSSNQGFRDKTDAERSYETARSVMLGELVDGELLMPKSVGPGKKPT